MASGVYGKFIENALGGVLSVNLDTDTLKVMLVTSSYTPDFDAHDYKNDVTNEVTGTGYTAGGATLGSQTWAIDTTDNEIVLDGADTTWTTSSITARGAVIYDDTIASPTADALICYVDFGSDKTSDGGTFQITWASEGIINIGY